MNFEMITLCRSVSNGWRQWHSFRCGALMALAMYPDWRPTSGGRPFTDMTLILSATSRTWVIAQMVHTLFP